MPASTMPKPLTSASIGISFDKPPSASLFVGPSETPKSVAPTSWPSPVAGTRDTPMGSASILTWHWAGVDGFKMDLMVSRLADHPAITVQASIANRGKDVVRLRTVSITPGALIQRTKVGGTSDEWTIARIGDVHSAPAALWSQTLPSANDRVRAMWAGFNMPVPTPLPTDEKSNDGRWRQAIDGLSITRAGGRESLIIQAVGPGDVEIGIDAFVESAQISLDMEARFSDVILAPGETRTTDEVLCAIGPWHSTMEQAMRWIASTHGACVQAAPAGWCSWYDWGPGVSTHSSESTARWFADKRDRASLSFFQLDDGFQRTVGDWRTNPAPDKFPGGLTPFVNAAQSTGGQAGIWLAPLAVHESCDLFMQHPDWMQHDASGALVGEANNWGPKSRWLDPTHPGAQQWLRELIRDFRAQGMTYFKIDFNTLEPTARWHDGSKTRLQVFRDLYRLYREEIGEHGYLLNCGCFTLRGPAGLADAMRIGPDSGAQWDAPHPCCIRDCVRAVVNTAPANGILYVSDPDVTYLRPRGSLTTAEWQSWHGFVGLLGGLTAISEPMQRVEYHDTLPLWEMLCAPVPEKGRALCGGADPRGMFFGFTARRAWGDFAVVQMHNPDPKDADITLDFVDIGLMGPLHVWSFWDGRYRGIHEGHFTARDIAPHGSMVVRLTPAADDQPIVISSDLHIGCGAAEIRNTSWKDNRLSIELNSCAGRVYGTILLHSAKPLRIDKQWGISAGMAFMGNDMYAVRVQERKYGHGQGLEIVA